MNNILFPLSYPRKSILMTRRDGLKSHVIITEPAFAIDQKTLRIIAIAEGFVRFWVYSSFEECFCFCSCFFLCHISTQSNGNAAVKSDLSIRTKDNHIVHSHRLFPTCQLFMQVSL